jgi:LytS/YehU family sensor histidine kinase
LSDDKNTLKHLEAFNQVTAKYREIERNMEVMEMNTRYETERKESQIQLLTKENELNAIKLEQTRYYLFALGGFILLTVLAAILLIRQNHMKAGQDKLMLEQRLLRAQMNPHFLFNTLSNIQSYMLENDMGKAHHYLSRFAKLMRNILDNSSLEFISLKQEISTMENYLEIQKIRFPDKFDYVIESDPGIDPEITFIAPMLAQPFIENAIEHGLRYRQKKGNIRIRIVLDADGSHGVKPVDKTGLVFFEVTDDGIGREQSEKMEMGRHKDHRPMATSITRERLRILGKKVNRRMRSKIHLEIKDLYNESGNPSGTVVRFGVPFELKD